MRELNEQELEQVAGGSGWTFSYVTLAQAGSTAGATNGIAYTKNFTASTHTPGYSDAVASNKSFAYGSTAFVQSSATSDNSVTISGN